MDPSRISIRRFELTDADDFLNWASDERVTRYLRWDTIKTKEEALEHIENVAMAHPWRRAICLDGRSIGYVSIKQGSDDDRCRAHVSYCLGADYWGQGIVGVALRFALPSVFNEFPDLVRVEAFVEVENWASQRVLQKIGFLKEGLLRKYGFCKGEIRDFLVFSFLSTDKML